MNAGRSNNMYECDLFQHCCPTMNEHLDPETKDSGELIEYDSSVRKYSFVLHEDGKDYGIRQRVIYCPWCGKKLPKDLLDEIEEALEKEYGIGQKDLNNDELIPPEFRTDEWWKKRGL